MLLPGSLMVLATSRASLVVCSTCRYSAQAREAPGGHTGGSMLIGALRDAQRRHAVGAALEIQAMPCLFACQQHCSVFLRSPARLGYLLGRFAPTFEAACALLDYAALYLGTLEGLVPYARWPAGVKGHFIARLPPEGHLWTSSQSLAKVNADDEV